MLEKNYSVVSQSGELLARVELSYNEFGSWSVYELYTDWYDTMYGTSIKFKDANYWDFFNYEDAICKFEYCKSNIQNSYKEFEI